MMRAHATCQQRNNIQNQGEQSGQRGTVPLVRHRIQQHRWRAGGQGQGNVAMMRNIVERQVGPERVDRTQCRKAVQLIPLSGIDRASCGPLENDEKKSNFKSSRAILPSDHDQNLQLQMNAQQDRQRT